MKIERTDRGRIARRAIFLAAMTCLFALAAMAQPATLQLGVKDIVDVTRDGRGVPYITAKNEDDLYFVQGYVTAGDRLWQMDLMRRVARGETAEIFGKATLEEDKRWRRFGFSAVADESLKYLSPELRAALESYSAGVNAYIGSLPDDKLPVEFRILQYKPRKWMPADSLIIGKILADALSSTWRLDLLKASMASLPKDKYDDLANVRSEYDVVLFGKDIETKRAMAADTSVKIGHDLLSKADRIQSTRRASLDRVGFYAEELAASNNWVISGKRTADGKPILANDPHLRPSAPGIWYLTHLDSPAVRVAGVTFPGVPGIVLGHNERIAWGATNVGPDVQDLYLETMNEAGEVKTPDGWAKPGSRKETIHVRANPLKPDTTPEVIDVLETLNGPVILEDGAKRYSLRWTAIDPKNNDFAAFFLLNRARSWTEFRSALSTYRGASQNFVYADVDGKIGWQIAGAIPVRRSGDGSLPYDGSTRDGDWTGIIPFDELPSVFDPPGGFIVTANQRTVGSDYKYPQLVREFAPPWRARRLYDLLSSQRRSTVKTVEDAQFDAFNLPLSGLAAEIVKQSAARPETVEMLRGWDGVMAPDSRAALYVNEIRECLAKKIADENAPAPAYLIRERVLHWAIKEKAARWLPKAFSDYPTFIRSCDEDAEASLGKRFGADRSKWTWGAISAARLAHPLAGVPLIGGQFATPSKPLFGSGQTPNVASAVSMRFIATPGNWDDTQLIIPLGQSGDPKSGHYTDQFEKYSSGQNISLPFSKEAIQKVSAATIRIVPR